MKERRETIVRLPLRNPQLWIIVARGKVGEGGRQWSCITVIHLHYIESLNHGKVCTCGILFAHFCVAIYTCELECLSDYKRQFHLRLRCKAVILFMSPAWISTLSYTGSICLTVNNFSSLVRLSI